MSGTSLTFVDDLGRTVGTVFDAGSISLLSERGGIAIATGSTVSLAGDSAELDLPVGPLTNPGFERRLVASDAGTLSLSAAEYLLIDADIDASANAAAGAEGGTLIAVIDGNLRGNDLPIAPTGEPLVSLQPRRIELERERSAVALPVSAEVPDNLVGVARLSEELIEDAGFSNLSLAAESLFSINGFTGPFLAGTGDIRLAGGLDLALSGSIQLNSANLSGGSGDVRLAATYVSLGNVNLRAENIGEALSTRTGTLTIDGSLVDVRGFSRVRGFDTVAINSAGDLRLVGFQPLSAGGDGAVTSSRRLVVGGLTTAASELSLTAAQVYPTTLTEFTVAVDNPDGGVLSVAGNGNARDTVLSAGATLRLQADTIRNSGFIRAPFGTIDLSGSTIELLDGSVTSTSLEGAIVPFGNLQAGLDWTYELNFNQTLVFDGEVNSLPEPAVRLAAADVQVDAGARIDISAGGDLQASEFVTGIGGTDDFLSPEVSPGLFAILPTESIQYAPIDPQIENEGSTGLAVGDTIFLNGIGNLETGTYTLLPARYALLPGALLVRSVDGYTDILPSEQFATTDGGVIVAGQLGNRSGRLDSRTSGFELLPRSRAFDEASYTLASATDFFADSGFRTPDDAGTAAFAATSTLSLLGDLTATAAGRGASVDISSDVLSIVEEIDDTLVGVVQVRAEDLSGLGAESVLIGGERTATADGDDIEVTASSVAVADGVTLTGPDLLLAATDTLSIGQGASVEALGSAAASPDLLLSGDSALLRVSSGNQTDIVRTGATGATGDLTLAAGSTLSSSGALALDATGDVTVDGTLDIEGGSLRLGANAITLGDSDPATAGLRLTNELLAGVDASELIVSSNGLIDVVGGVSLDVSERLVFSADGLRGASGAMLTLRAPDVELGGINGALSPSVAGDGTLQVEATRLTLGSDAFAITGFGASTLSASEALNFGSAGGLDAGGDLTVVTPLVSVSTGSDYTLNASGALRLDGANGTPTRSGGPGGRLVLTGDSVSIDTRIDAEAGIVSASATGALTLENGAVIDVSGITRTFDDQQLATPGGLVSLASDTGDVTSEAGSSINVSAPGDASAGRVAISASEGSVALDGELVAAGASLTGDIGIDANRIAGFSALVDTINAAGFDGAIDLRQGAGGDLTLTGNRSLSARSVRLVNDGGSLILDGDITLRGGDGTFAALNDVSIGGTVARDATVTAGDLDVRFISRDALVTLASTAQVVLGDNDTVTFELPRSAVLDTLNGGGLSLDGSIVGGDAIYVDGVARYVDDTLTSADGLADASNPYFADADAFMANSADVAAALGFAGDARFQMRPGVTIESAGDLTVADDINLFNWRFGDAAGVYTLRAAGDLLFDASLSDAFDTPTSDLLTYSGDSWSYRLVAGADLAAADPMQTARALSGDLVVAPGTPGSGRRGATFTLIRTGNGDIDIAAARDIVLGNQASVIYTAGIATDGVVFPRRGDTGNRTYPDQGGDLSLTAGRDIVGAVSDQLFTSWLWRTGREIGATRPNATAWTVAFGSFEQNVGALGGGDIVIDAGRDILELSASVPSIGRQVGGETPEENEVEIAGGGDLEVRAGGDIVGGSYLVGLGDAVLSADGSVTSGDSFAPVLGLGDGTISIVAREDLDLAATVNPTLLPQGDQQSVTSTSQSFFTTYADTSALALTSLAGDVTTENITLGLDALTTRFAGLDSFSGYESVFTFLPPALSATAFGGDVNLEGSLTLFPSSVGDLQLFAENSVTIGNPQGGIEIIQSDTSVDLIGTVDMPRSGTTASFGAFQIIDSLLTNASDPDFNAEVPLFQGNTGINRVIARTGDITMVTQSLTSDAVLYSARQIRLQAGRDINNFGLFVQHPDAMSVSSLEAGRDIIFPNLRTAEGALLGNAREIEVAGPGNLLLRAGRDIDLQTSAGVTTSGDIENSALPETGASVSLLAGLAGQSPQYAEFTESYLVDIDTYDQALVDFIGEMTGEAVASKEDALSAFAELDEQRQAVLLERILFDELRASGREAANPGDLNGDFTRGFTALTTMFPGANPDLENGETNAYSGDIRLFFSRIYTLDGGNVQLLVPGGEVNAGLASPPTAFGIVKGPEELGIVAQGIGDINSVSFGDFAVNESRVFAADGGNILIWSTRGDIDAGRGAKTAISAPPPQVTIDPVDGSIQVVFPAALTGSGIQTIATTEGREPGNVDLFAPRGVVNAGDAGHRGRQPDGGSGRRTWRGQHRRQRCLDWRAGRYGGCAGPRGGQRGRRGGHPVGSGDGRTDGGRRFIGNPTRGFRAGLPGRIYCEFRGLQPGDRRELRQRTVTGARPVRLKSRIT